MTPQSPLTIPLYGPFADRDGQILKDSRLINGMIEHEQGSEAIWVYKRPGLSLSTANFSAGASTGRGVFNWRGNIYSVFGDTLYKDGVSKGTVDANGIYHFTSCLGATPKLFLKNETNAYVYDDGGGLVAVSDGDYPSTTVPGTEYLDGGVYVADGTNNLYGSDFNDPTSWDPLNILKTQIEPDFNVAVAKQLVYVVVLKGISTEVFYDAGNATGSPLGPVQGSKLNYGCRHAGSVKDVGGDLCWVATSRLAGCQVVYMTAVRGQIISTPPVSRFLSQADYTTVYSWSMGCAGHRFYGVTLKDSNVTLVFDVEQNGWYLWTDASGNYLPIVDSTYDANGLPVLQHESNGKLYTADTLTYDDEGTPFGWKCYTPNWDGGERYPKTVPWIELVGDQVDTEVGVQWSDDDFQTYFNSGTVNLLQDRPMIQDGSSFRRRTYLLTNTDSTFLRMKAIQFLPSVGGL